MKKAVWIKVLLPAGLLLLIFVGAAAFRLANPAFSPANSVGSAISVSFADGYITVENRNDFPLHSVAAELYRSGQSGSSMKDGDGVTLNRWEGQKVAAGGTLHLTPGELPRGAEDLYVTLSVRYGFRLDARMNTINWVLPVSAPAAE